MKASVLIYEKLNVVPGLHILRRCNKYNIKRVKSDKLIEKEGDLYILGGF